MKERVIKCKRHFHSVCLHHKYLWFGTINEVYKTGNFKDGRRGGR